MTAPDVLTVPQAARRLGKNPHTLRRLIAAGEFPIPVLTVGKRTYIGVRVLDAFINGSTSAAPDVSHVPADVVETPGTGAVRPSPRDDTAVRGSAAPSSARVPNGTSRRTAPTTKRTPPVAAGEVHDNAAVMTRQNGA